MFSFGTGGLFVTPGEAIPRNFGAMFRFNAAVMGVAKQDWMYEAETRWELWGFAAFRGGWDGEIFSPIARCIPRGPYPKCWD